MSKCIGCGVTIQHTNPSQLGYVPLSVTIEKGEQVLCKRCFELTHYNRESYSEHFQTFNQEFYQKIASIKSAPNLVILILDVLDLYGGFIQNLSTYIGDNQVIILVNKIDVLPNSIKPGPLLERTRSLAKEENLNVRDVYLISSLKKKNIEHILNQLLAPLKAYSPKYQDLYVIGCASVGKSTFINTLLELYPVRKDLLTTSERYQTTLDLIKIPLGIDAKGGGHVLYDTPGFVSPSNINTYLTYESMKGLLPKQYLKVRTYQLQREQSLFLAGLAQIDFETGENLSASVYVANQVYVHRTKLANANDFFAKHVGEMLNPPKTDAEIAFAKDRKELSFSFSRGYYDLVISGLGFIHLKGENVTLKVKIPKPIFVALVPSFIIKAEGETK